METILYFILMILCFSVYMKKDWFINIWFLLGIASLGLLVYTWCISLIEFMDNFNI